MKVRTAGVLSAICVGLLGASVMNGCDKTISSSKSEKTESDGTVKTKEQTTTRSPDGTIKKEETETRKEPPANP
ncbi:MAG TPA: hypothetical protein VG711_03755 [Phycisphaerales bacterium]|nr:hypothetical protein [Phycisphaerales bacterium]